MIIEWDKSSKQQNGTSDTNVWLDATEQQPMSTQQNKILFSFAMASLLNGTEGANNRIRMVPQTPMYDWTQ
jgi:hypothetical protein